MITQLKYFHDIVVILAPGLLFSAKCAQFFFKIYEMKLNNGHFSFGTVTIHF